MEKENLLKPETLDTTETKTEDSKKVINEKDEIIEKLLQRVERLEKTSDKKRLDNYDRLNQEDPETIYKLRMIDGKIITGWSDLITNKAEVNPVTRKVEEDQTLKVYYEDKTEEIMDLIVFNRRYEYIYATLTEEKILKDPEQKKKYGNRIFTVKTDEGKTYEIGELFIN